PRNGCRTSSAALWSRPPRAIPRRRPASRRTGWLWCLDTTTPYAFWASKDLTDPELAKSFRSGDVRALARAISLVERRDPAVRSLEESLGDSQIGRASCRERV